MGYSDTNTINPTPQVLLGRAISMLKSHPNYKDQQPYKGESLIGYTLRCAAHLVSPPQEVNESYDVECTTISAGILSLEVEITERWNKFQEKCQ